MSDYFKKRKEQLGLSKAQSSDTPGGIVSSQNNGRGSYFNNRILELGLDKPKRIKMLVFDEETVEEENEFIRQLRQDKRFADFDMNAAQRGLAAYQRMKFEGPTAAEQQQKRIEQAAWAPLADAIPNYWRVVQQYANDTSWKEPTDKWNDDQRNAFGYLYAKDKEQAFQYAQEINEAINAAAKEEKRQAVQEKATGGFWAGTGETAKAIVAGMAGIGDYVNDVAEYVARGRITEKGDTLSSTEYSDAVTSGISEHLNKKYGTIDDSGWAKIAQRTAAFQSDGSVGDMSDLVGHVGEKGRGVGDVYGMGVSMGTSMLSGHALGRVGSLVQFFGSAAASAVDEAKSRGASDAQALAYGAALGASESLTELIPIDNLLNMGAAADLTGAMWNILKQSGEEFLGEGLNAIISNVADNYIMADKSNFSILKQDYMSKGFSEQEAGKEAWMDLWGDIAFDAISGGITGAASAGIEMGIQGVIQNRHYRKSYDGSTAELVQQGIEAPKDSLSHKLAESYHAKLNAGGSLSGAEIRRLAKANEQQFLSAEYDSIRDDASALLTDLGERENAVGIADIIAKKITKQKISKAEQAALDHSSFGIWVMDQLSPETFNAEWAANRIVPMGIAAHDYAARSENLKEGGFIQPHSGILKQQASDNSINATEIPGNTTELAKNATPEFRNSTETAEKSIPGGVIAESSTVDGKKKATVGATADKAEAGVGEVSDTHGASQKTGRESAGEKTVLVSTGETVKITRIASVGRNGDMKLELSDGSVVDAADVDHADEGESLIYSTIADLGAGVETSNELLNIYRNNPGGVSPGDYAAGMMEAFTYGQYHIPRNELAQNEAASALTQVQRNTAYELGSHFSGELVQSKEANIRRAKAAARAYEARMAAKSDSSVMTGKVHFDRKGRTFSDAQETGLKTMEQLSKLLGVEFHVFESYEKDGKRLYIDENGREQTAPNGWYDTKTGHIHIDLNAGSEGRGTVTFTVAHELTHHARQWAPEKFDELAKAVIELAYREQDISMAQLVQNQQYKTALDGREVSFDEAYEEVIADSMEGILADGNVLAELSELVREKDATLWEKIRDWFQKLAEDIRKMVESYKGFRPDTYEGRAVAELEGMLPSLEGFYTDALLTASENYRVSGGQKNTTQEGSKKNSFAGRDSATADHSALQRAEELARQGVDNVHDVVAIKEEAAPLITGTHNVGETGGATSTISIIRKILSVKAKQAEVNKKFSHRDSLQEKALEAARKENEKLKADVVRLKELVKLQGKVTGGTVFTEASMLTAARQLKKAADAKGDTGELVNLLKGFYRYTAEEKTLSWEGVQKAVKPAVDWLVKNRRKYRTEYAQEVLKDIRGRSISFSEEQKTEAARYMGSFNDYRKSMFGSAKISKEGMSLDETWHELSRLHPGVFPEDTVPGDMPRMLTEIVERMKNSYEHTLAYGEDMMRQEFLQAILDSRWELKTVQTVADRKQAEIEQLKAAHAKEMQEVRMSHQKSLTVLRQDHQESRNVARDIRAKAEIRHKIRSTVKKLDSLLKSETKERHVPDSMKKAVADALSLLNDIELGTAEKRIQLLQAEIRELEVKQEQAKGIGDQELAEALRAQLDEKMLAMERYEKSGSRLAALKDAYADIKNSKDPDIAAGYDAEVAGNLAELAESIKGTSFQEMSKEQLQEVYDMYTMVLTRVRDANKQLGARRGETLRENAEEVSRDIRRFGVSEDLGVIASAVRSGVRNFSWNELRPVDAFHRLGSEKLEQLYMDLVDGMAQRGQMVKEIGDFLEEARKKAGYRHFDLTTAETYATVDGKKMKLTLAEKMSIYAYSKRAQAFDHMAEGGFTYAKGLTYKGSDGKMKVREGKAETWRLSLEDLENICTSLTAEQQEYVDTVQQFLSEFGKHGDKVNMELYGIKLFNKEDAYFPLKSDRDYRSSVETQLNGTMTAASLKNVGMTKKTKPGANNPIVLDAFDHVVLSHLDEMVNYANLVLPLENLRRVLDYRTAPNEETEPTAMKALIGGVFGKEAQSYIEQFMVDANGTQMSGGVKNPLETMFTRNKGMAVAANLSVTIQQVSAVVRAAAEIAPQHLMWAAENGKGTKLYDEMVKYAPIAIIKDMGGFDTGNNRSLEDYIGFEEAPNSAKKVWNSMQKLFGVGAETMDKVGWCLIWNGVKREVASRKQYKVNSEEFLQECGKRFTEVIVKTQVYDSVLSRSGFMRDKHGTMRYLTSFMGEPTVQAGMVFRSHLDAARAMKSGDRAAISHSMKKLVRTDAALVGALIVNGMLKSIPYAMRDDDEDEGYWERWAKQFGSALSELWKPWELLPVFRNVEDWWSGKTIEQPDTVLLGDLMQAGHRVYDVLRDEEKLGEITAEDWYKLAQDLSGSLGNFLGVPVRNIWRDAEGIARAWKDATDGIDSDGMMLDAFWRGLAGDEKSKHEGIYDALVNSDAARLNALKATYKTDTAYESAVRKALRLHDPRIKEMADARYEGDYDRLEALSYEIEAEGVFDMETIQSAYEAERKAQAKERGYAVEEDNQEKEKNVSTVFSMEAYYAAIRSGNTEGIRVARNALMEQKEQEYYLQHEAEASLENSVTGKVKGEYLDEDISKADAISILTKYGGKTKEEAQTEIKKWEFQMKYHYAWGSRDRAYRSKSVSKSQLIAAVMDVEGASREEAQSYIDFLELEMSNETVEITAAEASRYLEDAQSRGISISRYIDYTNAQDNYIDGVKSEAETKRLLMEVGQLTEEDAELQIKVYKWTAEGYEGVTVKAVQEYEAHCAANNVPKDAYLHIRNFSNNTKNDVNPDTGRTVNYSAMKKVMAEIDKLSLSADQKLAIARSMGWSEKNIRKYKLW